MKVITANRLLDGEVVWLGKGGDWVETLALSSLLESEEQVGAALTCAARSVADREVVEVYEMDVTVKDAAIVPERLRERIRAAGPTTHMDMGKQAGVAST